MTGRSDALQRDFHFNIMEEVWKDIAGFEGCYQVSNLGNVKSLYRLVGCAFGAKKSTPEKILKGVSSKHGYLFVNVGKNKTIHRLVALAFIPNPDNKPCINHINGIKSDNRLDNLEWCTYSENTTHSYINSLQLPVCGSSNGNAILNETIVKEIIGLISDNYTNKDISKKMGIASPLISNIRNNRNWNHVTRTYNHICLGKGNLKLSPLDKEYIIKNVKKGKKGNVKEVAEQLKVCRKTILNFLLKREKNEHIEK